MTKKRMARLSLFAVAAAFALSVLADLPKVWTSCGGIRTVEDLAAATDDLAAHGVDVFDASGWWSDDMRRAALRVCREKGLRMSASVPDACRGFNNPSNAEFAVMIGGVYKGLAIDRNVFTFAPTRHRIVLEPPVYSVRQPYLKFPHYMMMGDGHYFGLYVPTGRAEVIVPEKPYDGRQHLRILPATVRRAPADAVVENDTAAKLELTEWIRDRWLVELEFDLTGLEHCMLDKVGLAVYWRMDMSDRRFRSQRGCYSLFSGKTRGKFRDSARTVVEVWQAANGGTFPSDVVIATRLGDEVFNHTGFLDGPAANLPLWGFSESGLARLRREMPAGETYPRQFGFPEIYGEQAPARYLFAYHRAAAEYLRVAVDELHAVGVKCFRNTTRGGVWSYANDHDGTGQELLARELDFLHLDPYPICGTRFIAETIPYDLQYMKGLSRRYRKPILLWMQAHAFGSGGLTHPSPEQLRLMYAQVAELKPDAIMWLGYGWDRRSTSNTFPWQRPDSWEEAAKIHAAFKALAPDTCTRADVAVVRPYVERAKAVWGTGRDVGLSDRRLEKTVLGLMRAGRPYDVFELPPDRTEQDIASELRAYREVLR